MKIVPPIKVISLFLIIKNMDVEFSKKLVQKF
jgi:hypothetical protein